MIEFETAEEMQNIFHKILVFGDSGSGKTFGSVLALVDIGKDPETDEFMGDPGVAILCFEAQARQSIKNANPKARVRMVEDGEDPLEVLRQVIGMARSGRLREMGIHTLVLDGLTEIQACIRDSILGDDVNDPSASFTWDDWRELNGRMRRLLRTIRSLELHVICTALSSKETDEEGNVLEYVPMFAGKATPNEVAAYFEAVGFAETYSERGKGGRIETIHATRFAKGSKPRTKPCAPLSRMQLTCGGLWVGRLDKAVAAGEHEFQPPAPRMVRALTQKTEDNDTNEEQEDAGRKRRRREKDEI